MKQEKSGLVHSFYPEPPFKEEHEDAPSSCNVDSFLEFENLINLKGGETPVLAEKEKCFIETSKFPIHL